MVGKECGGAPFDRPFGGPFDRSFDRLRAALRDRPLRDGLQEQAVEAIIKRSRLH